MKLARLFPIAVLATMLAAPALLVADEKNKEENKGQLSSSDFKFACKAAQGGMMEVQAGEVAKTMAASSEVKQFGERMLTDHGKAGEDLKAVASKKDATLPTELNEKHQSHIKHLKTLSGKEFDKAYVDAMVRDHKMDLEEFQKAAKNLDDPDLKAFAAKTATVIEGHLAQIKQIQANLKSQPTP